MKWFRFYTEVLDDIKIMQLSDYEFRIFVFLLAHACEINSTHGELTADLPRINRRLRTRYDHLIRALKRLEQLKIISVDCDGTITITNWIKRQFKSDNVTERVRKYRSMRLKCNVSETFHVTPPDTDTEYKEKKYIKKRKVSIPDEEWLKEIQAKECYSHLNVKDQLQKCLTFFETKGITVSRQRFLNWLNNPRYNAKPISVKEEPTGPKPKYKCDICGKLHTIGEVCVK